MNNIFFFKLLLLNLEMHHRELPLFLIQKNLEVDLIQIKKKYFSQNFYLVCHKVAKVLLECQIYQYFKFL
jgi:hypothetical protein